MAVKSATKSTTLERPPEPAWVLAALALLVTLAEAVIVELWYHPRAAWTLLTALPIAWVIERRVRGRRLTVKMIDQRSGHWFELAVVATLHGLRYAAVQHVGRRGDRGVDIIATDSSGTHWVIQCKRWRNPIGVEPVRLLAQARTC